MNPLLAFDKAVGNALERLVRSHHGRRLRAIGWEHALDPDDGDLWTSGFPPRDGNTLEVLIDGAEALPRMADEIRKAKSHVHIAGWYVSPWFDLTRDGDPTPLRALLAELAERIDVRMLLWAGSPLPLFHPDRRDGRALHHALAFGTKIRVGLDANERPMHCHHEKLVVIDDKTAFVGGIDLTSFQGDRFDSSGHPARGQLGWHDAAMLVRGPIVQDVAEHFRTRWHEVEREELPPPKKPRRTGEVTLQLARTVPERVYDALPHGDFGILEAYTRAFRSARKLIYLENQFFWSSELARILEEKLREPPSDDFRIVLVLPVDPNNGGDDTRGQLADLIECDGGRGRVLACTLTALGDEGPCPVYVHAKIGIVDDEWLTLGSANLNEHSMFNDTEVNLICRDPGIARETRLRLWSEHLEKPRRAVAGDPTRVVDEIWWPVAKEQRRLRDAGEPQTHRLSELPHLSRRTRRLLGPVQGLVVDG